MFWEGGWEWARLIGSYDTLGQTPHFYQPGQAAPCQTMSDHVGPCRHRAGPGRAKVHHGACRRVGLVLAHPCIG